MRSLLPLVLPVLLVLVAVGGMGFGIDRSDPILSGLGGAAAIVFLVWLVGATSGDQATVRANQLVWRRFRLTTKVSGTGKRELSFEWESMPVGNGQAADTIFRLYVPAGGATMVGAQVRPLPASTGAQVCWGRLLAALAAGRLEFDYGGGTSTFPIAWTNTYSLVPIGHTGGPAVAVNVLPGPGANHLRVLLPEGNCRVWLIPGPTVQADPDDSAWVDVALEGLVALELQTNKAPHKVDDRLGALDTAALAAAVHAASQAVRAKV